MSSAAPTPSHDPNPPHRSAIKANPTPLDVIFILFASVALVVFVLSFSAVRGAQPFQNIPQWLFAAISNIWNRFFIGAGAVGSLTLRKWIDRSPPPNYLLWICGLSAGLLAAVLFSASVIIPPAAIMLNANIDEPKAGQTVTRRTFLCKGRATGVGPETHLWLAIEVNNHIWPKERELHVMPDGTWENTIYEDGATDKFAVSLLSANPDAEKQITDWIESGKKTGKFAQLLGIPGTERIARVDGLRLKPN